MTFFDNCADIFSDDLNQIIPPQEPDYPWLLNTFKKLLHKAGEVDQYPQVVEELKSRGFLRQHLPYPRIYHPIKIIGEGGYGRVYKIRNLIDKQTYALKILEVRPDEVDLAIREVQCLAHLSSPKIVRYFASWFENGTETGIESDFQPNYRFFIQMEYVEGKSLEEMFNNHKIFTRGEVVSLLLQMAQALVDIHLAGIVHRDFRPANLMVRPNGELTVIDFGISSVRKSRFANKKKDKLVPVPPKCHSRPIIGASLSPPSPFDSDFAFQQDEQQPFEFENLSTIKEVGTPQYSSPQQLAGQKSIKADDIYSFGLIIFEILSNFKTIMEKVKKFSDLRNSRKLPEKFLATFPEESELILHMTDSESQRRPSAMDILQSPMFKKYAIPLNVC